MDCNMKGVINKQQRSRMSVKCVREGNLCVLMCEKKSAGKRRY